MCCCEMNFSSNVIETSNAIEIPNVIETTLGLKELYYAVLCRINPSIHRSEHQRLAAGSRRMGGGRGVGRDI